MSELLTPIGVRRIITWENAPDKYFWIDVGPFFDRIGIKQIQVGASSNPITQSILANAKMRQYIDLKRPDLVVMLDMLVSNNEITEQDKEALLNPITTEYERHIKGLPQPSE